MLFFDDFFVYKRIKTNQGDQKLFHISTSLVNFSLQIRVTVNDVKIHSVTYSHDMTIEVVNLHEFDNSNGCPLAQGYFYHNFPIVGSTKVLCLLLTASIPSMT